jgi:hypothetical protein
LKTAYINDITKTSNLRMTPFLHPHMLMAVQYLIEIQQGLVIN